MTHEEMMESLARDLGYKNCTSKTEELNNFDGYNAAWLEGRVAALIDEAVASLRFDGIPGIEVNGEAQHRVNQAIYSLLALRRLLTKREV